MLGNTCILNLKPFHLITLFNWSLVRSGESETIPYDKLQWNEWLVTLWHWRSGYLHDILDQIPTLIHIHILFSSDIKLMVLIEQFQGQGCSLNIIRLMNINQQLRLWKGVPEKCYFCQVLSFLFRRGVFWVIFNPENF